jgi:squalene-associated FAD-dependent desaturase
VAAEAGGLKVAVVGAGWAGLAAAVRATEAGHRVTVFEMAAQVGGRARTVEGDMFTLDNGQHILIGAYVRTLALMATVGADAVRLLQRRPLELRYPDGRGLAMPPGPAWLVFGVAVARTRGWSWGDRLALLAAAGGWALRRFRCPADWSVARLCQALPPRVRELMIDPLCVAALNTPAHEASATVFLRVLRDALFSAPGSADLLLPRVPLGDLVPAPASRWLQAQGAELRLRHRVGTLERGSGAGWQIDGEPFDAVVLAGSTSEMARLAAAHAPAWAARAEAMPYEPIVTVYLQAPGARLPAPMTALVEGPQAPAQFAFDHGALGGQAGLFAFVVSGARAWVERGLDVTGAAVLAQALASMPPGTWPQAPTLLRVLAEKRATFRCVPGLQRPGARLAPGLYAAGDHVEGPYPATLEGAVRSGEQAAALLQSQYADAASAMQNGGNQPPKARR